MSVEGIIFSNIHDSNISELTRQRTLASVPFGCRYRLIDFPLSNMVSSNINNISVITHYNYHSLMDHIGSGKDWDLARRSGGVKILPPYITAYANDMNSLYRTRLEALKSVNYSIQQMTSDYVVMSDCDVICNIDLNDMINDHIESGADITIAVKYMPLTRNAAKNNTLVFANDEGRITDLLAYPTNFEGYADVNLNILVINRKYLQEMVLDAVAHGYVSMTRDIFCAAFPIGISAFISMTDISRAFPLSRTISRIICSSLKTRRCLIPYSALNQDRFTRRCAIPRRPITAIYRA